MSRDLQIGECFIVAQIAVVLGLNVFDQPRFHEQRIDVAFCLDEVDVMRFAHQLGGPLITGCSGQEVASHAGAQVFRLADINHPAGFILKEVNTRRRRKLAPHLFRGASKKLRLRLRQFERRASTCSARRGLYHMLDFIFCGHTSAILAGARKKSPRQKWRAQSGEQLLRQNSHPEPLGEGTNR